MNCDVCNKIVSSNQVVHIPLKEMQRSARKGFNPFKTPGIDTTIIMVTILVKSIHSGQNINIDEDRLALTWHQKLMSDTTDWNLCLSCSSVVRQIADPGTLSADTVTQSIDVEAETLHHARERVKPLIPPGHGIISENIISDGSPKEEIKETIDIEARTLSEVREIAKTRISPDLQVISERIISDGTQQALVITAESKEAALAEIKRKIPANATIIKTVVRSKSRTETITISGLEEQAAISSARYQMRSQFGNDAVIKEYAMIYSGKRGVFGIGKKGSQYKFTILIPAVIEFEYLPKARILFDIGLIHSRTAKISVTIKKAM